eukprot:TRINITY_DN28572_c0_g1_i1.p1 TRINITY_DN28572_c0_g1~~TRINITY_DN28572_c0_g1_i1.p1  ORF type:complete len:631 (-),score=96.40 TRINITY_DN28572_c0_g1_i1:97-1989(-)
MAACKKTCCVRRFVHVPFDATGHINPVLPALAELVQRGAKATVFVDAASLTNMKRLYSKAGITDVRPLCKFASADAAVLKDLDSAVEAPISDISPEGAICTRLLRHAAVVAPWLAAALESLGDVDVVIYDPFVVAARAAAAATKLPCVSCITWAGCGMPRVLQAASPGAEKRADEVGRLERELAEKIRPLNEEANAEIKAKLNIDVLAEGLHFRHFSPDLNLIFSVPEFEQIPLQRWQTAHSSTMAKLPKTAVWVGPAVELDEHGCLKQSSIRADGVLSAVSPTASKCLTGGFGSDPDAEFPMEQLRAAKANGSKVVLASPGTVVVSAYAWDGDGKGKAAGLAMQGAFESGRVFAWSLWRALSKRFPEDSGVIIVASVGKMTDALPPELQASLPANFCARSSVPQVDVLKIADVFFSHMGHGSLIEACVEQVPLIAVPYFSDQYTNSRAAARVGIGLYPGSTHDAGWADRAAEAAAKLLTDEVAKQRVKAAASKVIKRVQSLGGLKAAADRIESLVRRRAVTVQAAPEGSIDLKVTTKKSSAFYAKSACNFLRGIEAKPTEKDGEVREARPAVKHLRISGLGDAVSVAVAAATRTEAEALGRIIKVQTAYPSMDVYERGCAQILIDVERR